MTTWLHYIGRSYYTERGFVREAREYGVTRRVSLKTLKRMQWGDRVILAIRDGATSIVFGQFTITKLSGLSSEAIEAIERAGIVTATLASDQSNCGKTIKRGCGCYTIGFVIAVEADLEKLAAALDECDDPGKPMIGGPFSERERVRLKKIKHSMGFRPFDLEAFEAAVAESREALARPPTVSGFFYSKVGEVTAPNAGLAETVVGYERRT